jgi:hypothetical protein
VQQAGVVNLSAPRPQTFQGKLMAHKVQKLKIVFYGCCGKRSGFTSQTAAEKAAIEYGVVAGYICEAFQCQKHVGVYGKPLPCWHFRAKTYPAMTREQWEQRAAERRLIEEKEAAEREAIRLQRVAEQEAARAEAAEREAQRLARQKARAAKLASAPKVPRRKYTDCLTTRQRWGKEGRCVCCGKQKERAGRQRCNACGQLAADYQERRKAAA